MSVVVVSGPDLLCNYGWAKYWDNANSDYRIRGLECTWLAGANDSSADVKLLHHKATGWTYNAGSTPTPPTALASMATDHSTESELSKDEEGAWKRTNLSQTVMGAGSEGIIFEITTTSARSFETGNILLTIRPD